MKSEVNKTYKRRIEKYSDNLDNINRKINLIVFFRLILVVLGITLGIYCFNVQISLGILISIAFAGLFFYVVKLHNRLDFTKLQLSILIEINNEEINRLAGNYSEYSKGEEYMEVGHPYASDLDLFGEGSLFQYINRTSLISGRDCLTEWLLEASEENEILLRQEAITELKDKIDWRQNFQTIGRLTKEKEQDLDFIMNWLNDPAYFSRIKLYQFLLIILPLFTISLLILSIFLIPIAIPVLFVLAQLWIMWANRKKINAYYSKTQGKYEALLKYKGLLESIEGENFISKKLVVLKNNVIKSKSHKAAGKSINKLAKTVNAFDWRLNMFYGLIINPLLMWDLQCIIRLEKWKSIFKDEMKKWFVSIREIDALISLGNYYFNNPEFTLPKISSKEFIVKASKLGHPLVNENNRICNDVKIDGLGEFMLITGSNMAGKSTFIRTVGINLVLAMSGAPVCSNYFEFYPMKIYTSMRVNDSLNNEESSFYAELKRLKQILDVLNKEGEIIVLLDEILKGTNSKDKHTGSEALIKQLIRSKCMGIIATHDLELGSLEGQYPENITNYCFEVLIKDEKFTYDYKLKEGVCQTLNATALMKHMGIKI